MTLQEVRCCTINQTFCCVPYVCKASSSDEDEIEAARERGRRSSPSSASSSSSSRSLYDLSLEDIRSEIKINPFKLSVTTEDSLAPLVGSFINGFTLYEGSVIVLHVRTGTSIFSQMDSDSWSVARLVARLAMSRRKRKIDVDTRDMKDWRRLHSRTCNWCKGGGGGGREGGRGGGGEEATSHHISSGPTALCNPLPSQFYKPFLFVLIYSGTEDKNNTDQAQILDMAKECNAVIDITKMDSVETAEFIAHCLGVPQTALSNLLVDYVQRVTGGMAKYIHLTVRMLINQRHISVTRTIKPVRTRHNKNEDDNAQPTDTQPTDTQATDTQPTDTQPTDTQPTDTQQTGTQQTDTQQTVGSTEGRRKQKDTEKKKKTQAQRIKQADHHRSPPLTAYSDILYNCTLPTCWPCDDPTAIAATGFPTEVELPIQPIPAYAKYSHQTNNKPQSFEIRPITEAQQQQHHNQYEEDDEEEEEQEKGEEEDEETDKQEQYINCYDNMSVEAMPPHPSSSSCLWQSFSSLRGCESGMTGEDIDATELSYPQIRQHMYKLHNNFVETITEKPPTITQRIHGETQHREQPIDGDRQSLGEDLHRLNEKEEDEKKQEECVEEKMMFGFCQGMQKQRQGGTGVTRRQALDVWERERRKEKMIATTAQIKPGGGGGKSMADRRNGRRAKMSVNRQTIDKQRGGGKSDKGMYPASVIGLGIGGGMWDNTKGISDTGGVEDGGIERLLTQQERFALMNLREGTDISLQQESERQLRKEFKSVVDIDFNTTKKEEWSIDRRGGNNVREDEKEEEEEVADIGCDDVEEVFNVEVICENLELLPFVPELVAAAMLIVERLQPDEQLAAKVASVFPCPVTATEIHSIYPIKVSLLDSNTIVDHLVAHEVLELCPPPTQDDLLSLLDKLLEQQNTRDSTDIPSLPPFNPRIPRPSYISSSRFSSSPRGSWLSDTEVSTVDHHQSINTTTTKIDTNNNTHKDIYKKTRENTSSLSRSTVARLPTTDYSTSHYTTTTTHPSSPPSLPVPPSTVPQYPPNTPQPPPHTSLAPVINIVPVDIEAPSIETHTMHYTSPYVDVVRSAQQKSYTEPYCEHITPLTPASLFLIDHSVRDMQTSAAARIATPTHQQTDELLTSHISQQERAVGEQTAVGHTSETVERKEWTNGSVGGMMTHKQCREEIVRPSKRGVQESGGMERRDGDGDVYYRFQSNAVKQVVTDLMLSDERRWLTKLSRKVLMRRYA
eukprot:GHVQ01034351.1.p1 GENE.GHVQ01034351.1~~GHVQ01034351.1.p1  ORF type:complete len:1238 (-),score=306.02 GHVQ01034351.1:185-3898(-)